MANPHNTRSEHVKKENVYYRDVWRNRNIYDTANRIPRRGSLPRFPAVPCPPSHCPAYSDRLLRVQTDRMPGYVPQRYRYPLQTANNYGWMVMYKDLNPPSPHRRRDIYKVLGWPIPT